MTFAQIGDWLYGYEDGEQVAQAMLVPDADVVRIGHLEAEGHFVEMIQKIKEVCKGKRVRLYVEYGDKMEKLVHAYAKFGATPVGVMMEAQL